MLLQQCIMVLVSIVIFNPTYPSKYNVSYAVVFGIACLIIDIWLVLYYRRETSNKEKTLVNDNSLEYYRL